jgi:HemY protein
MKKLFYFLGPLLATVAAAFFVSNWLLGFDNPGYVQMGIGHWSLETSLVVFVDNLIIGFYVFYVFFRLLG